MCISGRASRNLLMDKGIGGGIKVPSSEIGAASIIWVLWV